mmetsp:Transcript_22332/g.62278  ORF Transcript_22332/g.62278 Transcript_22332/m.62278 type:complete len:241 (+) Transcript_22332:1040-1762(+)
MTSNVETATATPSQPNPANLEVVVPTEGDFEALANMKSLAFAEKGGSTDGGKSYRKYLRKYPQKIQHCRVVKSPDFPGIVLGAMQLQLRGDPGDFDLPSSLRHSVLPGEAHVEFIATHPDHTGKGIGSRLLAWADEFSIDQGYNRLSLEVMGANDGAVRLYKRKGYVVKKDPRGGDECDACCTGLFVFCCLGCKYWTVLYMEKLLPTKEEMERARAHGQTTVPSAATTTSPQVNQMSRET